MEDKEIEIQTVVFVRLKCPTHGCDSADCPVQKTQKIGDNHVIRYHKCKVCGLSFKSVEDVRNGNNG